MLWLAYANGSSHAEIADVLGLKTGSIKLLLFRARRKLAATLQRQVNQVSRFDRHEPELTDARDRSDRRRGDRRGGVAWRAARQRRPRPRSCGGARRCARGRKRRKAVERPLTIVHGLAIAAGVGLLLSVVGTPIGRPERLRGVARRRLPVAHGGDGPPAPRSTSPAAGSCCR